MWLSSPLARRVFREPLRKIRARKAILYARRQCLTARRSNSFPSNTKILIMERLRVSTNGWRAWFASVVVHFLNGLVFCLGSSEYAISQNNLGSGAFGPHLDAVSDGFVDGGRQYAGKHQTGPQVSTSRENAVYEQGWWPTGLQSHAQGTWMTDTLPEERVVLQPSSPGRLASPVVHGLPLDASAEHGDQLIWGGVAPALQGDAQEQAEEQNSSAKNTSAASSDLGERNERPTRDSRGQRSKRRTTTSEARRRSSLLFERSIPRPKLPAIKGLKRSIFGLLASGLSGGAFPALAITIWGFVELLTSVSSRAALRGVDPGFTMSIKNWVRKEKAAQKPKVIEQPVSSPSAS